MKDKSLIPIEKITGKIFLIRKEKIMLDSDLAELYGVETRVLKQAVRRNIERFPKDFMFQLTKREWTKLITICDDLGKRKYSPSTPYVFTEQGVAMLSGVLKSERAVQVNIAIMRAFVQLRKFLQSNEELSRRLKSLEKETKKRFREQDEQIRLIFEAIKELITEKEKPKNPMGFKITDK